MKKAVTIAVVGAALAATLSLVAAGSSKRAPVAEADALPATEIVTGVRAMGLNPIGEPARRGPYYVMHAYDPSGVEVRVVADARFGDILSVAPARAFNTAYAPRYERAPRIIHVPQAGARDDRASVNERDEPDAVNDDDAEEAAPPAPRRVAPQRQPRINPAPAPRRRSDAPPPPPPAPLGPPRAVLSAPPPPAEGPSPIRPMPRYKAIDSGDKFGPPSDPAITSTTPTTPSPVTRDDWPALRSN